MKPPPIKPKLDYAHCDSNPLLRIKRRDGSSGQAHGLRTSIHCAPFKSEGEHHTAVNRRIGNTCVDRYQRANFAHCSLNQAYDARAFINCFSAVRSSAPFGALSILPL